GVSEMVSNDTYTIYLYEPDGFTFNEFICDGVKVISVSKKGNIRKLELVSDFSREIEWKVIYNQ
ncbi:MAG: hypothetical protein WC061_06820, partial [Melioribacteraceae bacterium]